MSAPPPPYQQPGPGRQSESSGVLGLAVQVWAPCSQPRPGDTGAASQLSAGQSRAAMDKESLRLQIDNMKPQSRMERWPLSRSIQA